MKNEGKHTKGYPAEFKIIFDEHEDFDKANQSERLVLAAPDLLAAAKAALSDLKICSQKLPCHERHERAQGVLRAAIARAEGK